jgi:hypothetical protein
MGIPRGRPTAVSLLVLVLAASAIFPAGAAFAQGRSKIGLGGQDWAWAGDVNLTYGRILLTKDDWEPAEEQTSYGLELDVTNSSHPIGFVLGLEYAKGDGAARVGNLDVDVESTALRLHVGLRKILYGLWFLRPYAGAGGTLLNVEVERDVGGETTSDSDFGIGAWGEVGTYIDLFGPLHIGVNARWGWVPVELFGSKKDAGGLGVSAVLGFHWED